MFPGILLLIPIFIFQRLDWHGQKIMLAGLFIIVAAGLAFYFGRRALRRIAAGAPPRFQIAAWEARYTAQDFQMGFSSYVKARGYQVLWFRVLDPARVALTIEKRRHKILLMCLRDAPDAGQADLARFARLRAEHDPDRAIIVRPAEAPAAAPATHLTTPTAPERLSYAGLAETLA